MRLGPAALLAAGGILVGGVGLPGTARGDDPAATSAVAAGFSDAGPPPGPREPLAGLAGERAFVRSPDNQIVLMPGLRLEMAGSFLPRGEPTSGYFLRRARVNLAGWLGPMFYFDLSGDFAPNTDPAFPLGTSADAYVAFAPEDDLFIVQAGQFDAPFTLENRTLEAYTPFVERSLAVRALGAPRNKDVGAMVHGADAMRTIYYAAGVFNGDGPGLRNADNQVDVIGRVVVSPFARMSAEALRGVALGGSFWYGQHLSGAQLPTQTTPGGFVIFDPTWTTGQAPPLTLALTERGRMQAAAGEISLPLGHSFGLRGELVWKQQDLGEDAIAADGSTISTMGRAKLNGIAGYGEAWVWLMGDDRLLPAPALRLPVRLGRLAAPTQLHGLTLVARGELLKEDLTSTQVTLGDPNLATTRAIAGSAAVNYWYGSRVRASANYCLTLVGGTSENVKAIVASGKYIQELLFAVGVSL